MSETKTLRGTIQIVEQDIQIPKNAGGTYPGTRITYVGPNGKSSKQAFHQVGLSKNPSLASDISALNAGDNVIFTYSINDKGFRDFVSIKLDDGTVQAAPVKSSPARQTGTKSNSDYATGAIKGNSVTNAVNIAIANGDTSLDSLKSAYELVISLHAYAEERGIEAKKEEVAKPAADGDAF